MNIKIIVRKVLNKWIIFNCHSQVTYYMERGTMPLY